MAITGMIGFIMCVAFSAEEQELQTIIYPGNNQLYTKDEQNWQVDCEKDVYFRLVSLNLFYDGVHKNDDVLSVKQTNTGRVKRLKRPNWLESSLRGPLEFIFKPDDNNFNSFGFHLVYRCGGETKYSFVKDVDVMPKKSEGVVSWGNDDTKVMYQEQIINCDYTIALQATRVNITDVSPSNFVVYHANGWNKIQRTISSTKRPRRSKVRFFPGPARLVFARPKDSYDSVAASYVCSAGDVPKKPSHTEYITNNEGTIAYPEADNKNYDNNVYTQWVFQCGTVHFQWNAIDVVELDLLSVQGMPVSPSLQKVPKNASRGPVTVSFRTNQVAVGKGFKFDYVCDNGLWCAANKDCGADGNAKCVAGKCHCTEGYSNPATNEKVAHVCVENSKAATYFKSDSKVRVDGLFEGFNLTGFEVHTKHKKKLEAMLKAELGAPDANIKSRYVEVNYRRDHSGRIRYFFSVLIDTLSNTKLVELESAMQELAKKVQEENEFESNFQDMRFSMIGAGVGPTLTSCLSVGAEASAYLGGACQAVACIEGYELTSTSTGVKCNVASPFSDGKGMTFAIGFAFASVIGAVIGGVCYLAYRSARSSQG
eukprot:TRINITY_DN1927_c0_g3_i1.p1 TRINITY_DN1927_c0_g3~~TRINITY_DN1927_c0_g3_i1.p1  ORF type:complete len:595 (+),score=105.89 TRINITY_DN1927_c0_g3_i1:61-1845(+)